MSDILIFGLVLICFFAIFVLAKHFWGKDALFVIGIGGAIGANIYNINSYPLQIGNFIFGFDSIIYTFFIFCLLVMLIDYGKESFNSILYSSVGSILLSAFLAFVGNYSKNGISNDLIWNFLSYIFSVVATLLAVWLMVFVFKKFQNIGLNIYVNILIVLLIASVVNSLIYFGLTFVVLGTLGQSFLATLAGSYIGKTLTIVFCLLAYFIATKWQKRVIKF